MMMVRQETSADIPSICFLHRAAFRSPKEADLVDALRANGKLLLSLVADERGEIIGHIAFSKIATDPVLREGRLLGLGPLAVLPDRQRRGIGAMLVTAGLNQAQKLGYTHVILLGGNYYHRFGFVPAPRYEITSAYNAGDHLMIRAVTDMPMPTNVMVKYEPEFAEAGC